MLSESPSHLSQYDFLLPPEQIAQFPAPRREQSRLLVIGRDGQPLHRGFAEIGELFRPGDVLVRNDTKVLPARLIGRRDTGGRVELLLLNPVAGDAVAWQAMAKPAKALASGKTLRFGALTAVVEAKHDDGTVTVSFPVDHAQFDRLLAQEGRMPLPPYIHRDDNEDAAVLAADRERYQTVYAAWSGAVAAPTAGLHFTPELFDRLRATGVEIVDLTLHVGAGTFLPVRTDNLDDHEMHSERFALSADTAATIQRARDQGRRVIAVGTTSARVLETVARDGGPLRAATGQTALFIRPGHTWRVVDVLVTNFHLPKSTLLVLVCALAGTNRLLGAYREAVNAGYRFFSYGDACWIQRV